MLGLFALQRGTCDGARSGSGGAAVRLGAGQAPPAALDLMRNQAGEAGRQRAAAAGRDPDRAVLDNGSASFSGPAHAPAHRIARSNRYMDGLLRGIVRADRADRRAGGAGPARRHLAGRRSVLGSSRRGRAVLAGSRSGHRQNYVAGVLLNLRRPFAPGDHVRIGQPRGPGRLAEFARDVLMTMDGSHLRLPNSLVFKSVLLNFSRQPVAGASVRDQRRRARVLAPGDGYRTTAALASVDGVSRAQAAPNVLIRSLSTAARRCNSRPGSTRPATTSADPAQTMHAGAARPCAKPGSSPPDRVQKVMLYRDAGGEDTRRDQRCAR